MLSKNILIFIGVLVLVGIVVYFYYDFNTEPIKKKFSTNSNIKSNSKKSNRKSNRKAKKVKFNDNIQYNEYSNDNPISNHNSSLSPSCRQNISYSSRVPSGFGTNHGDSTPDKLSSGTEILFSTGSGSTLSPNRRQNISYSVSDGINIDSIIDESSNIELEFDKDSGFGTNSFYSDSNIMPSNLDQTNPNDTWDASFGLPLMSKEEKKDYFNRMQKNFQKYGRALGDFYKYQTDRGTVITTETTIDPFKPEHRSAELKGRPIKEIFDAQVSGPKAKPKEVKKRTANQTIYKNEDVMNGGTVPGTNNLRGFQGYGHYKSAAFGNEF